MEVQKVVVKGKSGEVHKVDVKGRNGEMQKVVALPAVPQAVARVTRNKARQRCEDCGALISTSSAVPLCPTCLAAVRRREREVMAAPIGTTAASRGKTSRTAVQRQSAFRMRTASIARLAWFWRGIFN